MTHDHEKCLEAAKQCVTEYIKKMQAIDHCPRCATVIFIAVLFRMIIDVFNEKDVLDVLQEGMDIAQADEVDKNAMH